MSATLAVIWWRDIPAQIVARDGGRTHKVVLDERFQTAIDRAAVRAGLTATDDYLAEWRREQRACGDDLEAEAAAETTLLDAAYPPERLAALIKAGGKAAEA